MRKIFYSLGLIIVAAALAVGGTFALFSDTETSTGNIFTAGAIDLKVDHVMQSYNGVDCKTCSVLLVSDPTNMVVAKNGVPIPTPYPAVYLSPTHPAWTAQNDTELAAANAKWIWEQNPVKQEDTTVDTTYTFKKTFEWWGPITSTDLSMAVGHDNTVEVWLNGVNIGNGTDIYGFQIEHMLHIPALNITNNVQQGQNVLEIKLRNRAEPNGNPGNNPAGLIYKFEINGNCGDDYFKSNCTLFGEKDLTSSDHFWKIDDVKPGDHGVNVISLHVYDNDALACGIVNNVQDIENTVTDPEIKAQDSPTSGIGELSQLVKLFAWDDVNKDGVHDTGEAILLGPDAPFSSVFNLNLQATTTKYITIAWCAGTQDEAGNCSGAGNQNIAQTDSINAAMTFYVEQARNNSELDCQAKKAQLERTEILVGSDT